MDTQLRSFSVDTRLGVGRGGRLRLLALGALLGLLAAALLCLSQLAPAAADGHPSDLELAISLVDDSDNVVPPGSEFSVKAELRFSNPSNQENWLNLAAAGSALRISGYLAWEGPTWHRLDIAAQRVLTGTPLVAYTDLAAGTVLGGTAELNIAALDGRVLVARPSQHNHNLYVFDAWNKEQVAIITPPTGTGSNDRFARGSGGHPDRRDGTQATAVWHDDRAAVSWIFVGSSWDMVGSTNLVGRSHIYRLDWTVDPPALTLAKTLVPPSSEFSNHQGDGRAVYGSGLVVSQDGSTLAVAANEINNVGAVYVYSRPDGAGEDWSDIEYADGVKVTPVAIPSWGTATTRPYNPAALNTCDAYCSRVAALTRAGAGRSDFGFTSLGLSADGGVLVVGAHTKQYASNTPGGSFNAANRRENRGEAYVFLAPNGDWRTTPEVTGTLIAATEDASNFDPERHYSPGPMRRVTEPAAVLLPEPWTSATTNQRFGREMEVSDDGTTVAVSAHTAASARVRIFQRASASAWANAGELLPSATLTNSASTAYFSGIALKGDGSTLLYGDFLANGGRGHILVYSRPAGGQWTGTLSQTRTLQAPTPRGNGRYGHMRYDLGGERLATVETGEHIGHGFIWLSDGACTQRVVDSESSWTCPINLGADGAKVVVPLGTEDGSFSITGRVTLSAVGVADSAIELSDLLEVTVGTVKEVDSVVLGLATDTKGTTPTADDVPYPSLIERGEKTRLRLQILNANGKASSKNSVSSVVVTTTLGGLTSLVENGACGGGARRTICVIPTSALTSENVDELLVELEHMDTAGTAIVSATVLDSDGDRLGSNEVRIDVAGPPAALAIAPPPTAVLGYDPSETADQRNVATLVVSATDKGGNAATVPTDRYSAKLSDADGKAVELTGGNAKAEVAWPLREGDDLVLSGRNPQARVTILAGADAPLAPGEYTLELSAGVGSGKLTKTQTINVSGGATGITLGAEPSGEIEAGTSVTLTAMVTDANGSPVPNGTPVSFTEGATVANTVLVLLSPAQQLTSGGEVSVTVQAVGLGNAYVRAASDDAAAIQPITVVEPQAPGIEAAAASLTIGEFNIWTGTRETSADALFRAIEGLTRISKWDGYQWVSYGEANGQLHPGSLDFSVTLGTILWLSDQ